MAMHRAQHPSRMSEACSCVLAGARDNCNIRVFVADQIKPKLMESKVSTQDCLATSLASI